LKKWGQLSNNGFCAFLGDACDGGDGIWYIPLFPSLPSPPSPFLKKCVQLSKKITGFQKIPLYNNEVGKKKYSLILKKFRNFR